MANLSPGRYTVFPLDVVRVSDHVMVYSFEVLEGDCKGQVLQLRVDSINRIRLSDNNGNSVESTFDDESGNWTDEEVHTVAALRKGQRVYLMTSMVTVERIS